MKHEKFISKLLADPEVRKVHDAMAPEFAKQKGCVAAQRLVGYAKNASPPYIRLKEALIKSVIPAFAGMTCSEVP